MLGHFLAVTSQKTGVFRVLEIGTGYGFLARQFKERGFEYLGVEMNDGLAALTRELGLEVLTCTAPPFPERAKEFLPNVVWLSHVVEHSVSWRAARELLIQVREMLAPGGEVVIIGPDALWWKWEFWNVDWSHGYATSVNNVRQLLWDCGFEVPTAAHHTCGIFCRPLRMLCENVFRLIPYRLIDRVCRAIFGKNFAYSFMTVFGWRQIFLVGRKPADGSKVPPVLSPDE